MGSFSQGLLAFEYESDRSESGLTNLAGAGAYLDLIEGTGLGEAIDREVGLRRVGQGWTDRQVVRSLMLLGLAGGECVEDLRMLEEDAGLGRLLRRVERRGGRRQRREQRRRWRRETTRTVPSPSAARRYLEEFHDPAQEVQREVGRAWIPTPGPQLLGLAQVNARLLAFSQRARPRPTATLDIDATLIASDKREALYCYEKYRAYQPVSVWWSEQELLVHTEFRDGNVPAGFEKLRVMKEALEHLPEGVERVRLRADAAGYQHDLLGYCDRGESERFGRIEFAVGCPMEDAFQQAVLEVDEADWHDLPGITDQQWAEVCFVPNELARSKTGREYRYLAIREPLRQRVLPGLEEEELTEPDYPVVEAEGERYKVRGLVTNLAWEGRAVIEWYRQRCGKGEEVHAVMKEDLAGGTLPSARFGANAAWWWIMLLALNLNQVMKQLVLGGPWVHRRLKAIRFHLLCLPARIVDHARRLRIRLGRGHRSLALLIQARRRIRDLAAATVP